MESKLRNSMLGFRFARHLVIAAVKVVLPWSTWPMVPTLTCGLVRANFFFAIDSSLSTLNHSGGRRSQAAGFPWLVV